MRVFITTNANNFRKQNKKKKSLLRRFLCIREIKIFIFVKILQFVFATLYESLQIFLFYLLRYEMNNHNDYLQ